MRYAKWLGLVQLTLNHPLVRLLEAQALGGHPMMYWEFLDFFSHPTCLYISELCIQFAFCPCLSSRKVFVKKYVANFYK